LVDRTALRKGAMTTTQTRQMALESLKEEARANAFSNVDEDDEEIVVTEGVLMDLINELRFVDLLYCVHFKNSTPNLNPAPSGAFRISPFLKVTVRP